VTPPADGNGSAPLATLLARVEQDRERRCREILQAARQQADALRAEAYGQGRRRLHEAVREERHRVEHALDSARAEQETRQRHRRHRRVNAALERVWPMLEQALAERWRTADGRRQWLDGALEEARRFLPRGTWTVHHPRDLEPGEIDAGRAGLEPEQVSLETAPEDGLDTGVRIVCGDAEVDATPRGLLADRERVRSWLLAAVAAHRQEAAP